jgi:ribosomal protein S18 acetylase RimI-like enzyme
VGDNLVGTGTIQENHITRVYVSPLFQGKGYGTYIMKQLEERIRKNYDTVDIDASLPACRLYQRLGYVTVDHGIWECKNGVIQVYEIMKKELNTMKDYLKLRPYKQVDAETIVSWIKDERALRKWSSDRYGAYPITAADMNYKYLDCNGDCEEPDNFYPMTLVDECDPVGHLILRYTDKEKSVIRFGFVIVDDSKRGKGYGKRMLQMAIRYAFDMLKAEKITLGVFENNPSAYFCYKAAGFREIPMEKEFIFEILGEQWKCIELEVKRE